MLMLNWPSWEERRKGGEGRIEDGRPSQAKNAIAPVVGAGRPLCLDRTGSGDTQDEPRDHWHLLADRLVARARREVLGPTGRRLPIPCPGFGCLGAFSGCQPLLLPPPHYTPLTEHHTPQFPGPVSPFLGLTPGLFFFSAPPRAPPCLERAEIPCLISIPTASPPPIPSPGGGPLPVPAARLGGCCPFFWGRYHRNGALRPGDKPLEMGVRRRPFPHKHSLSFLSLNPIGREHKNVHLKHLIPRLAKSISRRRRSRFS